MQLDWGRVDAAVSEWPWGSAPFRLYQFNFAQYRTDRNSQDGTMPQAVWRFWLEGLCNPETHPCEATIRGGWHYTRQPGQNFAVLTAVESGTDRFVPPMDPEIPLDEPPNVIYAIAMNLEFCARVLLDRRYPEPYTKRDAILMILRAWELEKSRKLYWTIRTIAGRPCVLV